ncbi:MAG TPA: CxxxxCH/CxxCH domain-containing protein, partial [Polyangia bacterium]
MLRFVAGVTLAILGLGCTKARPLVNDPRLCPDWQGTIGPTFQGKCIQCHSSAEGGQLLGGYAVSSYNLAIGTGVPPSEIAGGADSKLVSTLNPATATAPHADMGDVYTLTKKWVVDCRASFLNEAYSVHTAGVMNPAEPDFHGTAVIDANGQYDLRLCQSCHGKDLKGGASTPSCLTCHQGGGAKACGACHAYPPATGAHAIHSVGGVLAKQVACSTCHPDHKAAEDHAYGSDGLLRSGPAQVALSGLAALTPANGKRLAPPTWDPTLRTCNNVYCHGATTPDSAAVTNSPSWDGPPRPASQACSYCHGTPPNGAGGKLCATCHRSVVDAQVKLINTSLHLNGTVDFADADTPCNACHGSATSNAPPPDLQGNTASSAKGVGMHQRHLTAPLLGIRGPIECSECHQVPATVGSPGHLGPGHAPGTVASAAVFPNVTGSGTLARAQSAQPTWNATSLTCSGSYCHGGGEPLNVDTSVGLQQTPSWVLADSGACHAYPPATGAHAI